MLETEHEACKGKRQRSPSGDDSDWDRETRRKKKKYRTRLAVRYETPVQKHEHPAGPSTAAVGSSSRAIDAVFAHIGSSSKPMTDSPVESMPRTESALESLTKTESGRGSGPSGVAQMSAQAPIQPCEQDVGYLAG